MQIVTARYVYVTSFSGDAYSLNVLQEDRAAVFDVEDALRKWGHYRLVLQPSEAELILAVRRGRLAAVTGGVQISTAPPRGGRVDSGVPVGTGPMAGAEIGSPDDTLAVFDAHNGVDAAPLWRRSQARGLDAPQVALVKELKKQVDQAAAKKP